MKQEKTSFLLPMMRAKNSCWQVLFLQCNNSTTRINKLSGSSVCHPTSKTGVGLPVREFPDELNSIHAELFSGERFKLDEHGDEDFQYITKTFLNCLLRLSLTAYNISSILCIAEMLDTGGCSVIYPKVV